MLVVRNVLFILFAANGFGDPDVNLILITTIVLGLIQAFMWLPGKVYKVLTLNILEAIFIMKLVFSAWTIFVHENNPDPVKGQMIAAYTITTVTIIFFMAIVCYLVWIAIKTSQIVKNLTRKPRRQQRGVRQENLIDEKGKAAQHPFVTYTSLNELSHCCPNDMTFFHKSLMYWHAATQWCSSRIQRLYPGTLGGSVGMPHSTQKKKF